MDAQLTPTEINQYQQILQGDNSTQKALAILEKHNGKFDDSLDELYTEKFGTLPMMPEGKSLWQVTLQQLRQEVCGDEGFRSQIKEYSKNPGSTPLLTGLIVYLVGLVGTGGIPIDPAIATVVVLYILKIGLNIFCEYTESSPALPPDEPDSRQLPPD
ncbi:MAG: hypothetical protein Fur006_25770 [Coleofasciculaceae cyanobacterium]